MSRRAMLRLLGAGLLAVGAVAGGATPAFAHAELLGTDPEYGAALTPGLDRVVVRYDLPVDVRGAQVTLASAADVVHFAAVSIWLGGLTVLGVVVLPRRRQAELFQLVPRFSRLAFGSVSVAAVAGTALLLLLSPRWAALPGSSYGRLLILKLGLVAVLLVVASRARKFVRCGLPHPSGSHRDRDPRVTGMPVEPRVLVAVGAGGASPVAAPSESVVPQPTPEGVDMDPARLRPFVTAVSLELAIAASTLAVTTTLVGRSPPT